MSNAHAQKTLVRIRHKLLLSARELAFVRLTKVLPLFALTNSRADSHFVKGNTIFPITVTTHKRLQSPATRSCVQQQKTTIKALQHWPFVSPPITGEFSSQRASDAERVSIPWRHRENRLFCRCHLGPGQK